MASTDNDDDYERRYRGGAAEISAAERRLLLDWTIPLGRVGDGDEDFNAPPLTSSRPRSAEGKVTFHFRHSFISKIPSSTGESAIQDRDGRQINLRNILTQQHLSKYQDLRNGRLHSRDLPAANYAVRVVGQARTTFIADVRDAAAKAATWRELKDGLAERGYSVVKAGPFVSASARLPGSAAAHQAYIERHGRWAADSDSVEKDGEDRVISFGMIGETVEERLEFWRRVEEIERENGRVQCRLVIELPYELTGSERRIVISDFARVFDVHALPWHAVAHKPDAHGDQRNYHCHVVYCDRPAVRTAPSEWKFLHVKDRTAQGRAWIRGLRQRYAEMANIALERGGHKKRYDHRSYIEMGIEKAPGVHLGPGASALERTGVPTAAGSTVIERERAFENFLEASNTVDGFEAALSRARNCLEMRRIGVPHVDRLRARSLELAAEWLEVEFSRINEIASENAARRARRDSEGRALRRKEWLEIKKSGQMPTRTRTNVDDEQSNARLLSARAAELSDQLQKLTNEWMRATSTTRSREGNVRPSLLQRKTNHGHSLQTAEQPKAQRTARPTPDKIDWKRLAAEDMSGAAPLLILKPDEAKKIRDLLMSVSNRGLQRLAVHTRTFARKADPSGQEAAAHGVKLIDDEAARRGVDLRRSFGVPISSRSMSSSTTYPSSHDRRTTLTAPIKDPAITSYPASRSLPAVNKSARTSGPEVSLPMADAVTTQEATKSKGKPALRLRKNRDLER